MGVGELLVVLVVVLLVFRPGRLPEVMGSQAEIRTSVNEQR